MSRNAFDQCEREYNEREERLDAARERMKHQKVKLNLEGLDGNAFALMGAFKTAARRQGADNVWVNSVIAKCMSGDYDNLLQTLMEATENA